MALLQALVIDAHMPTRIYVKLLLALKGFDSFTASSEVSAKQYMEAYDLDLIVAAVNEPGFNVSQDSRETGNTPPVVIYTRQTQKGRSDLNADAQSLSAPFAPKALYAAIERAFGEDADSQDHVAQNSVTNARCKSRKINMGKSADGRQDETKRSHG